MRVGRHAAYTLQSHLHPRPGTATHAADPWRGETRRVVDEVTALLDEVDAVVQPPRVPVPSRRARRDLVVDYLDVLLAHRSTLLLLCRHPAVLRHPALQWRIRDLDGALHERVAGRDADLETGVRSAVALGGALGTVVADPSIDADTIREVGARASLAALDGAGGAGHPGQAGGAGAAGLAARRCRPAD